MKSKPLQSRPSVTQWADQLKKAGLGSRFEAVMKRIAECQGRPDSPEPDWDDRQVREIAADDALTLVESSLLSKSQIALFERAGLNPKNPYHWRILFDLFCWSQFRPQTKRGAPKKWSKKYPRLAYDFALLRKEHPYSSNEDICKFLKMRYPHRYGAPDQSPSKKRIAKELNKYQDPKFNPALRRTLDIILNALKLEAEKTGREWNADVEEEKWREFLSSLVVPRRMRRDPRPSSTSRGNNQP
jgi:hypothetical protein